MLKKCKGTIGIKGCGEIKLEAEFSKSYVSLCSQCENKSSRANYKKAREHNVSFLSEIKRPWR